MKKPWPVVSPARAYALLGGLAEYVPEKLFKGFTLMVGAGSRSASIRFKSRAAQT